MIFTYAADRNADTRAEMEKVVAETLARRAAAGVSEKVISVEIVEKKAWRRGVHATGGFFHARITADV